MKKIPTLFERDWDGDRSRVIDQVHGDAAWVVAGEGVATRKYDGTACAVIDGLLYKRFSFTVPPDTTLDNVTLIVPTEEHFIPAEIATSPGRRGDVTKAIGWTRVGDGPDDVWHREAWEYVTRTHSDADVDFTPPDGIYELIGPKVQGNPERAEHHQLVELDTVYEFDPNWYPTDEGEAAPLVQVRGPKTFPDAPRDFDGLRAWLDGRDIEGLVWHHPDGRMAKIKLRDFGLERIPAEPAEPVAGGPVRPLSPGQF